jgi:molybdenum cofactor cytidylyltransferase
MVESQQRSSSRVIGVLLAAGRGRRMGRTKQLMPWPTAGGSKPLVAAAFDAVRPACSEMIVVFGHQADTVAAALGGRSCYPVMSDPDAEMFESVRAGLKEANRIAPSATVLLHPADQPEVTRMTLDMLLRTIKADPAKAVMPEFEGKGGHPVLIPPTLVEALIEHGGEGGLRRFWRDHPESCVRIPVDDPSVTYDLDTPDQYRDV